MKEAIKKALENDWNPIGSHVKIDEFTTYDECNQVMLDYSYLEENEYPRGYADVNYYHLIFGTDFIDKLAGDDVVCSLCGKFHKRGVRFVSACGVLVGYISRADYHRRKMANLKDIDALIEYVRGLVK